MQFSLRRGALRRFVCAVIVVAMGAVRPVESLADMLNGSAEFDAFLSRSTSRDASGALISDSKGTDFMHKYNLSLDSNPFPLLKLSAGSTFLQDINILHDMGTSSRSKSTTLSPYIDATLSNTLFQAALGFSRNESWQSLNSQPQPSAVNEEYHATLGWRPVGLPDLALRLSHANTFDVDRLTQDSTTNMATLSSQYSYKGVKAGYQFTGTDTFDNLRGTESTTLLNAGSLSYSDQFFNQRVSLYSHYNVNYLKGTNTAETPLFPVTAFSYQNTDPMLALDQNNPNGALMDSEVKKSAAVNLGVDPTDTTNSNRWNIGVDFFNATDVNKLVVWVDRQLPPAIVAAFKWQVWVRNRETDPWTQIDQYGQANSGAYIAATFGQFQNNFTITLNNSVKTRYIKVVVNRLDKNTALTNPSFEKPETIAVTELQALLNEGEAQAKGVAPHSELSRISQNLSFDVRTRILESLYHNLNVSMSTTTGGELSYVLDNTLSYEQRLNRIFSVSASAGREDISSGGQSSSAYLYTGSLKANPLPGLDNALVYSGRLDQTAKGSTTSNSIFVTNTAQPYKGVAFNLSGGYSQSTSLSGQQSGNVSIVGGTSIMPRQDLSFSLSYNRSITSISGGTTVSGAPVAPYNTSSQSGQMGVTYRPFSYLYLFASVGVQQGDRKKTQYVQNYGGTWSPFPDGTLQFNMAYNESVNSVNNEKDTSLTPTISWKIAPKAMLSLSYSLLRSDSLVASTEANYLSTVLRLSF